MRQKALSFPENQQVCGHELVGDHGRHTNHDLTVFLLGWQSLLVQKLENLLRANLSGAFVARDILQQTRMPTPVQLLLLNLATGSHVDSDQDVWWIATFQAKKRLRAAGNFEVILATDSTHTKPVQKIYLICGV